jgi:triacylglycerol lipase
MDGVLTLALIYGLVCTLPVVCGYAWMALERGEPLRPTATDISWFAREIGATALIFGLMPFGWWPSSPTRKRRQRDIAEAPDPAAIRNPVLLVHGYSLNRACFTFLKTYLHTRGWEWVWAANHRPRSSPIPVFAKRLGRTIERLKDATGADKVDLVCHSMGGVVAAYALKEYGYSEHVRRVITLGTPWAGTKTYVFCWMREGADLAPSSEVIAAIADYQGDTVAIWSQYDQLMVPLKTAAPDHARTVEIKHLGHVEMLTSARVFRMVADSLQAGGVDEE